MFESFPNDNETIKVRLSTVRLFTQSTFVTKKTQIDEKTLENTYKNLSFVTKI